MSGMIDLEVVDPDDARACVCIEAYFAELDCRFPQGFDGAGTLEADAELLRPPRGAFVLALIDGEAIGCGVVHTLEPGVGEIKRMWVAAPCRRMGVGLALLGELERIGATLGHRVLRLDTNENLPEAIEMYRSSGYLEIDRYNDNPYPTHFFEKPLG